MSLLSLRSQRQIPDDLDRFTTAMRGNVIDFELLDPVDGHADLVRYQGHEHVIDPNPSSSIGAATLRAEQIAVSDQQRGRSTEWLAVVGAPTPSGVMLIRPVGRNEDSTARRILQLHTDEERARRKAASDATLDAHLRPIVVANLTVREAASIILKNRGRIDVGDDGIVIHAPIGVGTTGNCKVAAEVLYAAERHVIAWHEAKRKPALPDQRVTPNGVLI